MPIMPYQPYNSPAISVMEGRAIHVVIVFDLLLLRERGSVNPAPQPSPSQYLAGL